MSTFSLGGTDEEDIKAQKEKEERGLCRLCWTVYSIQIRSPSQIPQIPITNLPPSSPMSKQFKCQRHKANKPTRNNPQHPSPLLAPSLSCIMTSQHHNLNSSVVSWHWWCCGDSRKTQTQNAHRGGRIAHWWWHGAWDWWSHMTTLTNIMYRAHRTQTQMTY